MTRTLKGLRKAFRPHNLHLMRHHQTAISAVIVVSSCMRHFYL